MKQLLRSQIAQKAGINIETLRFYEQQGIIPVPDRAANGYRLYPESTLLILEFIQYAKAAGFTLAEIRRLLSAAAQDREADTFLPFLEAKLKQIEQKKQELELVQIHLQEMKANLAHPERCLLCRYYQKIE